jgi:FG-GAP repeat
LLVGTALEDSNQTTITNGSTASADNSLANPGAVYVYKRTGSTWAQEAYIKAANANANDSFGSILDLEGDTIVVSATGEDANVSTITNGSTASSDNSALQSGAAYVYKRTGVNWAQEAYLKASNANANDYYGMSVGVSGDTIVVGAHQEDSNQTTITNGLMSSSNNSSLGSGAAYIYKRTGTTWVQEAYLKPPNTDSNDHFGERAAIDKGTIVITARDEDSSQTTITNGATASGDNSKTDSGAVYVFTKD